jgi:hypothetical protein
MQTHEVLWDGRGELTEWPQRDWFILLRDEGFQPIWDRQPRTPSMLLADAARNQSGATLDAEAWHDNALVRTTSAPRLMNADRLKVMQARWSVAIQPGLQKPPAPEQPVQRVRRVRVHRVASAEELLAQVQVLERLRPDAEVRVCSLTNKVRHDSKLWALHHRNRLAALPEERFPERLEAYKCKGCGDWHVGHKV